MRPAHLLATAALAAALLAGCGSSSNTQSRAQPQGPRAATTSTAPIGASARGCAGVVAGTGQLRVAGVGCDVGRGVVAAWVNKRACLGPADASRPACGVRSYRCLGVRTARGTAVSCAQPGRSISFVAKRH